MFPTLSTSLLSLQLMGLDLLGRNAVSRIICGHATLLNSLSCRLTTKTPVAVRTACLFAYVQVAFQSLQQFAFVS
jgi:hypothetical protein